MTYSAYPSLEAFYNANESRRRSPEADYGVWWTEASRRWPKWRVSYVKQTGEVYAVQTTSAGHVAVLGIVPPDDGEIYYQTLDRILKDWADHCGQPGGLAWVMERLNAGRRV